MEASGVYAVARSIWDDPDFGDEEYSEREAWLWLLGAAAWKPIRRRGNTGKAIDLERGEFSFAVSFLAKKWHWASTTVHSFLKALEKRNATRNANRNGFQIYYICKYNDFQVVGLPKRNADGMQTERKRNELETLKHSSIEKKEPVEAAPPSAAPPKPRSAVGSRWPSDHEVPPDWLVWVRARLSHMGRAPPNIPLEAVKFANYWASKTGRDATKIDWKKTFLNWCLNAKSNEKTRSPHDSLNAGVSRYIERLRAEEGGQGEDCDIAHQPGQLLLAS